VRIDFTAPHDEDLARPTGIAAIPYAVYKGVDVVKRHGKNQILTLLIAEASGARRKGTILIVCILGQTG
jgi:hypothetical protein